MGAKCCTQKELVPPVEKQAQDEESKDKETRLSPTRNVRVHVGPLEFGPDGVLLKPKFNLGIQGGVVYAMAGVRDVRDGLAAEALALFMKTYATSGSTLTELLENVKAQEEIPGIDDIIAAVPDIAAAVLDEIGVDITLECIEVEGVVYLYVGTGVAAGAYLGWLDTSGYRTVGIEGKVAAAAGLGFTIKMGTHEDGDKVRLTCYWGNAGFDVICKFNEKCIEEKYLPHGDESDTQL